MNKILRFISLKKTRQLFFRGLIFISVLLFTFILRTHNFDKTPPLGHLEEMLYGWSGIYLVETGVPVSWSTLDYPERATFFKGKRDFNGQKPDAYVTLRKPWLDAPPLFSLIVGYTAHLYGASRDHIIHSAYLRAPTIIFAAITSIFVFLIGRMLSGYWTGILSMIVYGTTPIIVFGSRMAVPENIIALFFSVVIYLLLKFEINPKFRYVLPIPILAGLAGLSKPTGYFILPLALFLVFAKKYYKYCLYLLITIVPFILLYFAYGYYYDWEIFWKITSIQSQRPVGFSSLGWFFVSPSYNIYELSFVDTWYIFCLLSAVYFLFHPGSSIKRVISLGFAYWIIIVMISGGEGDLLPWYRFVMFPLLSVLGAWGLQLLVEKSNFFTTFLGVGMLIGNKHLLVNAFRPNISPLHYRLVFSSLMLPSVINFIYEKAWLNKIVRIILISVMVVGVYYNSVYIYNQFEIVCEGVECNFGPPTKLSSIHFPFIWRFFVLKPI